MDQDISNYVSNSGKRFLMVASLQGRGSHRRALVQTLGVSRTVTSSAYDELFAEGYLEGRQGSGT